MMTTGQNPISIKLGNSGAGHFANGLSSNNLRATGSCFIPLSQNKFAKVDDADFEWLSHYKWCANYQHGHWYAVCKLGVMHRLILNVQKNEKIDHKNDNGLDNRRTNIRICSRANNMRNRKRHKNNVCGYKGVSWHKTNKKWQVSIQFNEKSMNLGYFDSKIKAAKVYDQAARKYFGEFARTNF